MARVISDECVSCGTCEGECPVGAISEGTLASQSQPPNLNGAVASTYEE